MAGHGRGRRRKGGHAEHPENHERWLITYADLITLLMVFFIVLYSMATADSDKFKKVSAALTQAFNVEVLQGSGANTVTEGSPEALAQIEGLISSAEVPEAARIKNKIESILQASEQMPEVSVGQDREGVVIRLSGSYLFDSGRAELKPNSLAILDAIASELKLLPNDIRIDGHTDSTPLTDSPRYPTNWELSTARALAVTRYFSESAGLRADRLMAAGFGEFRPLAPNDTRERRAANRRVEIHVLSQSPADRTTSVTAVASSPRPVAQEH
jgi:chemotaxis protein MotB